MAAQRPVILHGIPGWVIQLCKRIATWQGFVWTNLLGLVVGLLGTWLTSTSTGATPLETILTHWPLLLVVLGGCWLVFGLSATLGRLPEMNKPLSRIKREYLTNVIAQREKLEIEGIPAPLMYDAVALEDIFILPRFKPHRPLAEQTLTDSPIPAQALSSGEERHPIHPKARNASSLPMQECRGIQTRMVDDTIPSLTEQ